MMNHILLITLPPRFQTLNVHDFATWYSSPFVQLMAGRMKLVLDYVQLWTTPWRLKCPGTKCGLFSLYEEYLICSYYNLGLHLESRHTLKTRLISVCFLHSCPNVAQVPESLRLFFAGIWFDIRCRFESVGCLRTNVCMCKTPNISMEWWLKGWGLFLDILAEYRKLEWEDTHDLNNRRSPDSLKWEERETRRWAASRYALVDYTKYLVIILYRSTTIGMCPLITTYKLMWLILRKHSCIKQEYKRYTKK